MTAQLETMAGLSIQSIRALVDEAAGAQYIKCGRRTHSYDVNTYATETKVFTAFKKLMAVA